MIVGQTVRAVRRRGKFVVLELEDGACVVHLRMSGRLEWSDNSDGRHVRAVWTLGDGTGVFFHDARKFGRVRFVSDYEEFSRQLGPEPLARAFTAAVLSGILSRRQRLKAVLLDQRAIAGLGNIYTDEALFRARLHPLLRAEQVQGGQVLALHAAVREVLREAIRWHGSSIDWVYPGGWMQRRLAVYGRQGAPCKWCGWVIVRLRVAGRGTHICPRCQRIPRGS